MVKVDPCLVMYRDRYYFGTLHSLEKAEEKRIGLQHTDVVVVGIGKERFAVDARELMQKQGYTRLEECPTGTVDCDAVPETPVTE